MTDTATPPTAEEIAAARAIVEQADATAQASAEAAAAAAAEARTAALAPLKALASSDGFTATLEAALAAQPTFASDPLIAPHIAAICVGMANLKAAVA